MQWLIDIAIESMKNWYAQYGGIIDRGYTATPDFVISDLILDQQWHLLDLSGIIPDNTKFVFLLFLTAGNTQNSYIRISKPPELENNNQDVIMCQLANMTYFRTLCCGVNENKKILYAFSDAAWYVCDITVRAWTF